MLMRFLGLLALSFSLFLSCGTESAPIVTLPSGESMALKPGAAPVRGFEDLLQKPRAESCNPSIDWLKALPKNRAVPEWMWEAVERYQEPLQSAVEAERAQRQEKTPDVSLIVFISEGMPEGVLRHLFKQAFEEPKGTVRFVLRGFEPQKLGPLIGRLRSLFPDPTADHVLIDIDPNLFRAYHIEAVPVYLVKEPQEKEGDERWYEVQGAISLDGAREAVRQRSHLVMGELYSIREPDMLSVIEARARDYDWSAAMRRAQARMANRLSPSFDLPTVTRSAVEYFEPTFTVPHDITIPANDGKSHHLLVKSGTLIKILDHTTLDVPMIVFDPSDARQVKLVRYWIAHDYAQADLFVIGSSQGIGDQALSVAVAERLQRPTYPWFGRMTDRFGVRAVPAIVEQEGQRLKIRYVDPYSPPENFP